MPKNLLFLVLLVAFLGIIAQFAMAPARRKARGGVKARRLLSDREQAMFHRLTTAWNDGHVLTQVSMGALISAKDRGTRNTFDRKFVDFVLVNQAFDVVAVIELDDASHQSKREADRARDALLQSAGYATLRYANIPDLAVLVTDVSKLAVGKPM
jgi:very-short-patch-repair endonuclease